MEMRKTRYNSTMRTLHDFCNHPRSFLIDRQHLLALLPLLFQILVFVEKFVEFIFSVQICDKSCLQHLKLVRFAPMREYTSLQ